MDQASNSKGEGIPVAERSFAPIRPNPAAGQVWNEQFEEKAQIITDKEVDGYKEQDRFLPIANVSRIMKKSLPSTTKISKEAKECVQECTSEFISFVTSEASERCLGERRKTLSGEDVLYALTALGFENYSDTLKIYLAKWRNRQFLEGKRRRGSGRALIKKDKGGGAGEVLEEEEEGEGEEDDDEEEGEEEHGARDAKRQRVDIEEDIATTAASEDQEFGDRSYESFFTDLETSKDE